MKKFLILFLTIIAFGGFTSCEHDDDVVFVAQPDPEGVAFTNSFAENYTLISAASNNLAERFVWNEVNFDAPTTVTYELQASTTSDFSDLVVIGTTSETNMGVTVGQMMDLAEDAGLDNDPTTAELPNSGQIFFRVRAYAGTDGSNGLVETSQVKSLSVTLPEIGEEEEETKTELFLVGSATAAGWDNNNNNTPLFRDSENDNLYYFQGNFTAGEFKLLEIRGMWQPQWGTDDGTTLAVNPGDGTDPGVFAIDSEGYYSYTFNTDDMTFTKESIDASSADTYGSIGVIGTATTGTDEGWNADMDLTQSSFNPHIWYSTEMQLFDGEMKFRANDAWDVNWGGDTEISGKSTMNGPNIPVSEGTYEIWFNDLDGRYILIPVGEE
ncbi:SusF/SusE family outer membrane protein [Christiangramia sp.]|uniref:SusF/SusE family outer membrane protein n=1 Tax=Christiangramia sp. TaxID=1931228 RepID=UPI00260B446B|nr:SusF/SusE family outer membrane protein [Christiangramia sp.]